MHAAGSGCGDSIGGFLLGYLVILATPGPNLLAIGSIAALHGLRAALPLCLGIALGAGALGGALVAAAGSIPDAGSWTIAGRLLGVGLLLWVAAMVARGRPPDPAAVASRRAWTVEFGAAFCTAACNPLTAAFFAAQLLGPLAAGGMARFAVPAAIVGVALPFFLGVATLLARPLVRNAVLARHRPIRLAASAMLVLMALSVLVA